MWQVIALLTFLTSTVLGSTIWTHVKPDDTIIIRFDTDVGDKHAKLVCKFRPNGMDEYTPMDWTKPNLYFPMLNPGASPNELVLGYWNDRMVGWFKCAMYDNDVFAAMLVVWFDESRLSKYSYNSLPTGHDTTMMKRLSKKRAT